MKPRPYTIGSLLCRIFGHRWTSGPDVFPDWCPRCGEVSLDFAHDRDADLYEDTETDPIP